MKKIILGSIAALAIATIAVFNVQVITSIRVDAPSISLATLEEVAVANNESNNVKELPKKTERVHCVITSTTTTSNNNTTNSNSGWNAGGSVNAGWGPVGGSVSGGYNSGSSNGSSSSSSTSITTTRDFWADKIMCQKQTTGSCTPFDPCH